MFDADLLKSATALISMCTAKGLTIATAESCTGGLVAGLLTEIPGSSAVVDRGFVTYSNQAKYDLLDVRMSTLTSFGAVSEETAREMAEGALRQSAATLTVAITGIAGPGGGSPDKPVGLVHLATALRGAATVHQRQHFSGGRVEVRMAAVRQAISMLMDQAALEP